jgi:hypothetical protein
VTSQSVLSGFQDDDEVPDSEDCTDPTCPLHNGSQDHTRDTGSAVANEDDAPDSDSLHDCDDEACDDCGAYTCCGEAHDDICIYIESPTSDDEDYDDSEDP